MERRLGVPRAESLAESLFSLEEPWRGRFLAFVARQATRQAWDGRAPTREEVLYWLGNEGMCQTVALLLHKWHGGV